MDKIKDMFKGLPKWAWWVIGGGAALLLFFGLKANSSGGSTSYSLDSAGTTAGGTSTAPSSADIISYLNTQLASVSEQMNEQSGTYMEGLAALQLSTKNSVDATNTLIANQNDSFSTKVLDLTSSIKEVNESTRNQLVDVLGYVDKSNQTLTNQINTGLSSSQESINTQYNALAALISNREMEEKTYGGSVSINPVYAYVAKPIAKETQIGTVVSTPNMVQKQEAIKGVKWNGSAWVPTP